MSKGNEPRKGSMLEVKRYTEASAKRARRFKKRPCGSDAPVAPTGLSLTFVNTHKERKRRWQAKLLWNEVDTNEYGASTVCDRYNVQVQHGTDGANPVGETRKYVKNAKDEDADATAHMILDRTARRYYYRFRVQGVNKAGCRSSWSSWTAWQQPGAEAPPAPTSVKTYDSSTDRVVVEWGAPADPNDADRIDEDIDYFQVQVSISSTFATTYKFDRRQDGMRKSFKVSNTESGGSTYYTRVRSVNAEGDKSSWIPATLAGNSNPATPADGVVIGAAGSGKTKVPWNVFGRLKLLSEAQTSDFDMDEGLTLAKVRARVKVAPLGSSIIIGLYKNGVSIGTVTIAAGAKRGVNDGLTTTFVDSDRISCSIDQVGSSTRGENLVVVWVFNPT
jgi:hypothetical protein